jgi:hypothetical protein
MSRKRRSAAARQAAKRSQSKAQAPRAWWKQPLVWIGSLVTALAAAAAAAFGSGLGTSLFSAAHSTSSGAAVAAITGPPVLIDSVSQDPDQQSFSYVLPQRLILSGAQLQSLNRLSPNDPAYSAWFTSRGGVQPEPAVLKLVVEGNRAHPVLIIDMGITDTCTSPPSGTYFANGSNGGSVDSLAVVFDLDLAHPVPGNGQLVGSYFSSHSVSLGQGEQEVFKVVVDSTRYCRYQITLTVVDGTKTETEVVSDHGQPFKVSGLLAPGQYQALYVGGGLGTTGPFTRRDPATGKPDHG